MTVDEAATEPIPRVTPPDERSAGERRARRRRLLGDVATYTALVAGTFVVLCVAGLAWLSQWSVARDPGARLFSQEVSTVHDVEWTWDWGLPTFRAEGITYDGTVLVGAATASPWIYAPVVAVLVWWFVVRARLTRPVVPVDQVDPLAVGPKPQRVDTSR